MKTKLLIIVFSICLITNGFAKIYIYQNEKNEIHLSNTLEENSPKKYIEHFDKYQLIYASDQEIDQEKQKQEQIEQLDMQAKNEFKYDSYIFNASKEYDVEFILIKTVVKVISKFDENYSQNNRFGIMGIKKGWVDTSVNINNISVQKNINIGTNKLKSLLIEFNYDLSLTFAAYFLNSDIVWLSLEKTGSYPMIDKDCYNFVTDCIRTYNQYQSENPEIKNNIKKHYIENGKSMMIFNTDIQNK